MSQNSQQQSKQNFSFNSNGQILQDTKFPDNFIKTTKYNLLTFFPISLFNQFKNYANIYFLIIATLTSIKQISPIHPASSWGPLSFVVMISLIREFFDFLQRRKSDIEMNSSETYAFRNGILETIQWAEVKMGDILFISENETFPADLIVIDSSLEGGQCYIQTSSLDGEKNLKPKQVIQETLNWNIKEIRHGRVAKENEKININGEISCGQPNSDLYQYQGTLKIEDDQKQQINCPINVKQLLLRGAKLKNTRYIYGIVTYTGTDTKVIQNSSESKFKKSTIDKITNKLILIIFFISICFSTISAIAASQWNKDLKNRDYLDQTYESGTEGLLTFFSYFILNNTLIPISLVVTLEIVKNMQGYIINVDDDMYCKDNDRRPKTFTFQINEELGQVQYIFSDKTGTLTSNKMCFKYAVIGQDTYGEDLSALNVEKKKIQILKSFTSEFKSEEPIYQDEYSDTQFDNCDINLQRLLAGHTGNKEIKETKLKSQQGLELLTYSQQRDLALDYMLTLSVCHECIIEPTTVDDKSVKMSGNYSSHTSHKNIRYQGPSPDEVTLVDTARHYGFVFIDNSQNMSTVDILGKTEHIKILQIFEFNSDRKRMSVIIKFENQIKLLIKGADNVIKERLSDQIEQPYLQYANDKIKEFSQDGLRTLLVAVKPLSSEEYEEIENHIKNLPTEGDRDKMILEYAEKIENKLFLIGATAVEDKLQQNVPEVISDLQKANIKIWMLTGDKKETAENIAKSCKLIQNGFVISNFNINQENQDNINEQIEQQFQLIKNNMTNAIKNNQKKALIIEGCDMTSIFKEEKFKDQLIEVVKDCEAVICCRSTPNQKADIVRLVKNKLKKITLAIGDGANDVNMIQEANIGIGLYGQEGMRAVQSSDYALPEFQALWKLLLVHGRWNYIRNSEMILYFFYKNFVFTLPQFIFSFYCGFSAQPIYPDIYITLYNLMFTAVPVIAKALIDQDIYYKIKNNKKLIFTLQDQQEILSGIKYKGSGEDIKYDYVDYDKNLIELSHGLNQQNFIKKIYPYLYYIGQDNTIFNYKNFAFYILAASAQAVLVLNFNFSSIQSAGINEDGHSADIWLLSISIYTSVIFIVTIKIALNTQYWTIINFFSIIVTSLIFYLGFIVLFDYTQNDTIFKTTKTLLQTPDFYSVQIVVVMISVFPQIFLRLYRYLVNPLLIESCRNKRNEILRRKGAKITNNTMNQQQELSENQIEDIIDNISSKKNQENKNLKKKITISETNANNNTDLDNSQAQMTIQLTDMQSVQIKENFNINNDLDNYKSNHD